MNLRFIERDGKRVLQQQGDAYGQQWDDVPGQDCNHADARTLSVDDRPGHRNVKCEKCKADPIHVNGTRSKKTIEEAALEIIQITKDYYTENRMMPGITGTPEPRNKKTRG